MSTLRDLFERIQDVAPLERDAWMAQHCTDGGLRVQLDALLRQPADGADLLSRPIRERLSALDTGDSDEAPAERWLGRTIGAFRLVRLIGQGGMAVVFEAERVGADFTQRVALKVLKRLVFSAVEERLFRRERQALAALTHPNIARLIDGGVAEDGTPFLAVELVDGLPITDYCEARKLELRARLLLFATVCRAVEAAHHALIVHRDIKPANILVTMAGAVKLLDFGIAKLLDEDGDATGTGLAALTPDYAAPEQFVGGPITTATDVYSLGVLLHELIVGERPTAASRRPSSRSAQRAVGAAATNRPTQPPARLQGDLNTIVRRALEVEPERRYGSAGELADDIERHLAGQPVNAHPPSTWYRTRKFVQRHRGLVAVTLTLLLGVLTSLGMAMWQARRAEQQAVVARQQTARAVVVRDFVVELMRDLRPGVAYNSPQTRIEHAEQRARARFAADPETRAELLLVIGEIELGYGRLTRSRALLEEAASIAQHAQGRASRLWLEAEAYLGHTVYRQGNYIEGTQRLSQALLAYDRAGGAAGAARVRALTQLGMLRATDPDGRAPLGLQREAVQLAGRVLSPTDPLQQTVLENYGDALANAGRLAEARPVLIESLGRARQLYGSRDIAVISALEALAVCEIARDAPSAALPLLSEAQSLLHELVSGPHVMAAYVANTRGQAELHLGRPAAAQTSFEQALEVYRKLLQPPHPMLAATQHNLGEAAFELSQFEIAAAAFDEAAAQREASKGSPNFDGYSLRCLAGEARTRGAAIDAGIAQLQHCIDAQRSAPQSGPEFLAGPLGALADAQWRAGDRVQAERHARQALLMRAAPTAHERLLLLAVSMRADSRAGRQRSVQAAAKTALATAATTRWTRPCQTAQLLWEIAELAHSAGDPWLAAALRERAARGSCQAPPRPVGLGD